MYQPVFYKLSLYKPFTGSINGIKINLVQDCRNILEKRLKDQKIMRKSLDDPIMDYFRLQERILEARPRRVYVAKDFQCPKGYEAELAFIRRAIEAGRDLNRFMSRTIKRLTEEDLMLYDWGIYHFHLSKKVDTRKKDGFMERSPHLLLAKIDDEAVYMIKVVSHNKKNVWTHKNYIQAIEENWPETIRKSKMDNMTLTEFVSEENHYKLRKAGITTFTQLDNGNLYAPLGGGYASDRSSTRAVRKCGNFMYMLADAEKLIVENFWLWMKHEEELEVLFPDNKAAINIKLIEMWKDNYLLKEEATDLHIRLELKNNIWNITICEKQKIFEKEWKNLERY